MEPELSELTGVLQRFWEVEDLPKTKHLTREEKLCETNFKETHFRREDGRYVVTLPFTERLSLLGKSKSSVLRQFFSIERKMERNAQFATDYLEFMDNHEKCGYMTLNPEDNEDGYYTPHTVYSSNKFRVVFNASNPTSTGLSLNECQMVGEKLQDDLAIILMRFRLHKVALCADIKQMYCQVEVNDDHKKYQKILWRKSRREPVRVYVLNRVVYGQTSAPYLAIRAMQQCARDHEIEFPSAEKCILNDFYVDDLLTGTSTAREAILLKQQLSTLLGRGKFELAKWCSNSTRVHQNSTSTPKTIELNNDDTKKVLGLQWHTTVDSLAFTVVTQPPEKVWTKNST